jgi:hypothetical protein
MVMELIVLSLKRTVLTKIFAMSTLIVCTTRLPAPATVFARMGMKETEGYAVSQPNAGRQPIVAIDRSALKESANVTVDMNEIHLTCNLNY